MDDRTKDLIEAAKRILPEGYLIVPLEPAPSRRWPLAMSPGDFTVRFGETLKNSITPLAAMRTVLIEDPPAISPDYLTAIAV